MDRPRLSRQARVVEDNYEPTTRAFLRDFPYVDEACDNGFVMYDRDRLGYASCSGCVHSFSLDVAETTFTVPIEINHVDEDRTKCSMPLISRDEPVTPVVEVTCLDSAAAVEDHTHVKVDRQTSEVFCHSDRSDLTPTEDLYYYTDCQVLCNTSSATEDDIFYSQLDEMTLSNISASDDLPADTDLDQGTFCCDMFSPGIKDDAKSVLAEELEEDSDRREQTDSLVDMGQPEVPMSHVQSHFSDCFPI